MIHKKPYSKPQTDVVWLPAPTVLNGTSGYSTKPGTWESNFDSFFSPDNFGISQFPTNNAGLL